MAQSLRTISIEAFRLQVYKVPSKSLEKLREEIYEIKRSSIGSYIACDLERKETIIIAELMRRKYLQPKKKPGDFIDFNNQTLKYKNKKRLF